MSMTRRSFVTSALALSASPFLPVSFSGQSDTATDREVRQFVRELRRTMRRMLRDQSVALPAFGAVLAAASVTTDTVVLTEDVRGAGSYTSGTFSIPASITFIRLFANIGLADKLAVGEDVELDLQQSTDAGQTFSSLDGFGWTSYGPDGYHVIDKFGQPIDNPDPSLGFNPQAYVQNLFRLVLTLPQPTVLGATVEITTG